MCDVIHTQSRLCGVTARPPFVIPTVPIPGFCRHTVLGRVTSRMFPTHTTAPQTDSPLLYTLLAAPPMPGDSCPHLQPPPLPPPLSPPPALLTCSLKSLNCVSLRTLNVLLGSSLS